MVAIVEAVMYSFNEEIGIQLSVSDIGGSMIIHMFGAFFGLAVSFSLIRKIVGYK